MIYALHGTCALPLLMAVPFMLMCVTLSSAKSLAGSYTNSAQTEQPCLPQAKWHSAEVFRVARAAHTPRCVEPTHSLGPTHALACCHLPCTKSHPNVRNSSSLHLLKLTAASLSSGDVGLHNGSRADIQLLQPCSPLRV